MFKKQSAGYRIYEQNLSQYLTENYSVSGTCKKKILVGFKPLLQKNFGGDNDCTLTSITAIQYFKEKHSRSPKAIYLAVESTAKNFYYDANKFGTIPIFIKNIINKTFKVSSHAKYMKNIGFNWNLIKGNIDKNIPMVLSLWNDGRNYYSNHSITIVGYVEYVQSGIKMLAVYDNWYDTISYVDYNKLSSISCINYF